MHVALSRQTAKRPVPTTRFKGLQTLPETHLANNTPLFHEGDDVKRIYQVVSGVVSLTRVLEDGRRQIIAFGFPGDIIGFPFNGCHHTDCGTLTPTRLQPYRLSQIEDAQADPKLHHRFVKAALREIAAMQDHFMMLGRKTAAEKVASFLTVLADRTGTPFGQYTQVDIPMNRADIADYLGLTTETISRVLTQLRKSRMIALDGAKTVIILRRTALQALATGKCD